MNPLPPAAADREVLEGILRESGVVRRPAPPSLAEYASALQQALVDWLGRHAPSLAWVLDSRVAQVLLWLLVVAILAWLAAHLLRRLHRRSAGGGSLALEPPPGPVLPEPDRATWRRELEARLLRGDVAAALEALWWWLARSLCGPRAHVSWTSRELLLQARRADLGPLAAALDRMAYGGRAPTPAEVRLLARRFEESLG